MRVAQTCILTMHIFCVLFLRPFKNAKWILAGQLSWSARSPQKLSVPFERHSTSLARDSSTHFAVSTWARCSIFWKIKRKWISMVSVVSRLRGFWLGSCDQLWAETTQYGRGAGCDCKFLGHLHVSLNTYSIYHAWEQAVWMHYVCAKTAWSILWLACRGYYYGCAVGGCNYGGPHASRVISKNWTPCGKFWTYAFLTFAACKYAFLLCIFGYRFCIWHSWACAWTTTHNRSHSNVWQTANIKAGWQSFPH